MRAAMVGDQGLLARVYASGRRERLEAEFDLLPGHFTADTIHAAELKDVELIFSTWGMPCLSAEEIAHMQALKGVFYAAGSVQSFAQPFLESGIKVISGWAANAVPVAEYTVAQILLCNKGFYSAARAAKSPETRASFNMGKFPGNFNAPVALLGCGMIGRGVIERLKPYVLDLLVFDPYLSDTDAAALGVEKVSLEDAFRRGFVVSNHLANLPETVGMLHGDLFRSMQPHGTFINTGRGPTVDEAAMIQVLWERPDLTAVLDVTHPEPPDDDSMLYELENVVLTPHIAGSASNEVLRLADYIIEESIAFRNGNPLRYEVTLPMLATMA